MTRIVVKVEGADKIEGGLKRVRTQLNRTVKEDMAAAAQRFGEPAVKSLAPGRVKQLVRAGSTTRTAYVEVQKGPAARRLFEGPRGGDVPAILNYGGVRRDPLTPSKAQAMTTPHGVFGAITGHRRYTAQRFLERGVDQTRSQVLTAVDMALKRRFEAQQVDVE